MRPELHRGELWWADLPGDQRRPVLVLTREPLISRLTRVLVAPVTSTVRGIPTELPVGPEEGLRRACAANFDNILTVPRELFEARIGRLHPARLPEICAPHRFAVGC